MKVTERLIKLATDYEVRREHRSKILKGERIKIESLYRCPRCDSYLELPNSEWKECPKCELEVARFGNLIKIRAEVDE